MLCSMYLNLDKESRKQFSRQSILVHVYLLIQFINQIRCRLVQVYRTQPYYVNAMNYAEFFQFVVDSDRTILGNLRHWKYSNVCNNLNSTNFVTENAVEINLFPKSKLSNIIDVHRKLSKSRYLFTVSFYIMI